MKVKIKTGTTFTVNYNTGQIKSQNPQRAARAQSMIDMVSMLNAIDETVENINDSFNESMESFQRTSDEVMRNMADSFKGGDEDAASGEETEVSAQI